jgi:putative ABC transport system permease protein
VPLDDGQRAMFDDLVARVRSLPGVEAVTVGVPPTAGGTGGVFLAEDSSVVPLPSVPIEVFVVRPDYFQVVGIPLVEGRLLGPEDRRNTPLVAVISDNVAGRFWPGQSPIGRRFRQHADSPPVTVVGVVPRVRTTLLARETAVIYLASTQATEHPNMLFRIAGDAGTTLNTIRQEIRATGTPLTLARIGMVDTLSAERDPTALARFYALLFGVFAGIAVLTAAVGLYGLLAYSVSRRTREIGVRMALGASVANVRRLVLRELSMPVAGGILVGLFVASQLAAYLRSRLFEVEPGEPMVLAAVVAFFLIVSALAALVPVRRATRVDPAEALRAE